MNTAEQTSHIVNGVDTEAVVAMATGISQDENMGQLTFRADNRWIGGAHSRTSIQGFSAGGNENDEREVPHIVDADQPVFLGGENIAPNPVEYLLHALNSCLTVTLVYHAAVQGIRLGSVEVYSEGDMDARGFFGISEQVAKGYRQIRVRMRVESDADAETLKRLALYSPVYEVVSKAVAVDFEVVKV